MTGVHWIDAQTLYHDTTLTRPDTLWPVQNLAWTYRLNMSCLDCWTTRPAGAKCNRRMVEIWYFKFPLGRGKNFFICPARWVHSPHRTGLIRPLATAKMRTPKQPPEQVAPPPLNSARQWWQSNIHALLSQTDIHAPIWCLHCIGASSVFLI